MAMYTGDRVKEMLDGVFLSTASAYKAAMGIMNESDPRAKILEAHFKGSMDTLNAVYALFGIPPLERSE